MHEDVEISCARVFETRPGKMILNHLRAITLDRALGPDATDAELRHLEGQRALVKTIENLIKRGKNNG